MSRTGRRFVVVAAVAAVALMAPAVSTAEDGAVACAGATASPSATGASHGARATVCLINAVRHRHGLGGLRVSAQLSRAARKHSGDMVNRHYFAHATPEGLSPTHRVAATGYLHGYRRWTVGETLAWWRRAPTPARIVAAWMHSAPHREVILTPSFREVGIGIVLGMPHPVRRSGATYTADFGFRR